jgi:colanic acid/amylovoran biosynthesis glycosyltransferase
MSQLLRIAIFVGSFPILTETFIMRQIIGLLDLGHEVDIFADTRAEGSTVQPEINARHLPERTTYMDMPPEAAPWEMPVWPITGRTWLPGSERSVSNAIRVARAFPKWLRCVIKSPQLTQQVLARSEYGFRAASLSCLYRLARLCGVSRRYDVLHAHFGPVANSFRFARALWRAPLVVSFHGYDMTVTPRAEGKDVYRNLFRDSDTVTINSEYARGLVRELGCSADQIKYLRYGVEMDAYSFRERSRAVGDPVRLLTVGRFVQKKGIEFGLRAVAIARRKHPGLHYHIVGDGPLRSALEKIAAELRLENHVTFHGFNDNHFNRQQMTQAHIFALPSVTADNGDQEGTPISLIEAQASGLPVLSTRYSGIPEIVVDGKSGFLVPERDIPALAEKLMFLIERPELCNQFGACGRKHVEAQFELRRANQDLVRVYEDTRERFQHSTVR